MGPRPRHPKTTPRPLPVRTTKKVRSSEFLWVREKGWALRWAIRGPPKGVTLRGMETRKRKATKNFRFEDVTLKQITALAGQWEVSETAAVARAIQEAWEAPVEGRIVIGSAEIPLPVEGQVLNIPASEPVVESRVPYERPEKPLPKSFAQKQREDLERRAAVAGVCPDCGDKLPWCSC